MELKMDGLSRDKIIEALIQNTPIAYIVLDEQYRIHFLNESFQKLRNLDRETTIGELCYNISNKGVPCEKCSIREALDTGERAFISRKDIFPDGRVRYLDDYAIPLVLNRNAGNSYILEIMVDRTAVMAARAKRRESLNQILEALILLLESKDAYTAQHSRNVHRYATVIAERMGFDEDMVHEISVAGLLHDIGKVDVPFDIINKPNGLNDDEYAIIKGHPKTGDEMLDGLSQFVSIRNHVRHHHERIDGKGYPDNIENGSLSIGARILAVADTYDAMTTDRPYRKALTHEEAAAELTRVAGSQLDLDVVRHFLEIGQPGGREAVADDSEHERPRELERTLASEAVKTENLGDVQKRLDFKSVVDDGTFLKAIFDNTPCGYALFNASGSLVFASDYLIEYLDLDEGGLAAIPFGAELVDETLSGRKVVTTLQEATVRGEDKAFELYSIPVPDDNGEVEHVVWCTLDRTEEIQLERSFEQDFMRVIGLIKSLVQKRVDAHEYADDLQRLEARLEDVMTLAAAN